MELLEALTLGLGPTVAKAIAKFWLKDLEFGQDIAKSLVDFIKSKTSDVIAQQRAKRQFEAIGERVAESLLPVFEAEGASLDEGGRISIALAVKETLNKSRITPELLAERNLDPTSLAAHLRDSHPTATRDYSEAETALYDRIIDEVSRDIVDIASDLPTFTERTFAEVLKRENELIEKTDRILLEVGRIREESRRVSPKLEAARFEEAYLRDVARKLDQLELFGVDVARANRRHSLNVAYVTLSVDREVIERRDEPARARPSPQPEDEDAEEEEDREIVSVDEALAGSRFLLIRGPAGSGKTTLLQWVAVRSASRSFEGELESWNDAIPFFIRLRQCVEPGLPAPEDFPRLVTQAIAGTMPEGWVHEQLGSGRAVVLVDGVDEVPATQKTAVREWLRELVGAYPEARLIVTSRPYAVEEGWLASEGFDDAELQEMEPGDIAEFIEHWHHAVGEALEDEQEAATLPNSAEKLKGIIRQNQAIRNLATTPLLCAMLCALNRERRTRLPSDRIELYEGACYALVERRDPERGLVHPDYPQLSYRQKLALLEDLAYWLLNNDWAQIRLDKVQERLKRKLANMGDLPANATAESVCRLLVERTAIVREPQKGQMDFAHRTFQEYLAAQAVLDQGDIGVLVKNAHNEKWRETIILAAGRASTKVRGELIKGLIARGDEDGKRRHQLHLLAVACLETAVDLAEDVKQEVQERLAKLIPPENITEAKALASAGELVIPHLLDGTKYRASRAAACIRTLALIGGDEALKGLKNYAQDARQLIWAELFRAASYFDESDFAKAVLARITQKDLTITVTTSALPESVARLTHLESLSFTSGRVKDISALARLVNLRSLSLIWCDAVRDLRPLGNLRNLASLDLSYCRRMTDLSPLAGLGSLTSLNLGRCTQVSDLSSIAGLGNLTSLDLNDCPRVTDLSPLAGLGNLATLDIGGCPQVSDLSPLAGLGELQDLTLTECPQVSDLSPLAGLGNLTSLNLYGCKKVTDLSPLAGLGNLTKLYLHSCRKDLDLSPLKTLRKLKISGP